MLGGKKIQDFKYSFHFVIYLKQHRTNMEGLPEEEN